MKQNVIALLLVLVLTFGLVGCNAGNTTDNKNAADKVVYGTIYTAEDENNGMAEAFAVKDNKFIYVGDKEGAEEYVKPGVTEVIDKTDAGLIIPGCTEGHAHFFGIDSILKQLPGFYAQYDELLKIIKKTVKEDGAKKFFSYGLNITGLDLDPANANKSYAKELEKIAPGIPVVCIDNVAHSAICNVTALKKAGLWKKQDVRGAKFGYTEKGEFNGIVKDQGLPYVIDKVIGTMLSPEQYKKAMTSAIDNLHDRGFTNSFDAWANFADDSSLYKYIKELDDEGKLNMNVAACYNLRAYEDTKYKKVIDHVSDIAKKYKTSHFNPYFIKLFADGVVESRTGWMIDKYPFAEKGEEHGNMIWSADEIADITSYANSKDILIHTHAYGDGACKATVEAYLASNKKLGKKYRNGIGHARNIRTSDIKKIAENGISVAENQIWHSAAPIGEFADLILPKGSFAVGYPIKSFIKNGVKMSSSTDSPCGEVIPGNVQNIIEVATTGMDYQEKGENPPFNPSELITVREALKSLTINGAWQLGIEKERGSIKVGKYADFSFFDTNFLDYTGEQLTTIHNAKITDIYFEGKPVYKRK